MYTHLNHRGTTQSAPLDSAAARFIDELSMDVLVKSFNRPYGLDRCLCSLRQHLRKARSIRVLDDGTPGKYLDEIKRRHPQVEILRSERHAEKSGAIEQHRAGNPLPPEIFSPLPWELWRSSVASATPRFLLLNDGQWCVREINLGSMGQIMKTRRAVLVKIFNSPGPDRCPATSLSPEICQVHPWVLRSRLHTLFYQICRACRLGNAGRLAAEALYAGSGIFERSFWLDVTGDAQHNARDPLFLRNRALEWASHHRRSAFARTTSDPVAATLRSSASSGDLDRAAGFDLLLFNKLLNEYWFAERLDPCAGMPGDFPEETILTVLAEAGEANCTPEKWSLWCEQMKENTEPARRDRSVSPIPRS